LRPRVTSRAVQEPPHAVPSRAEPHFSMIRGFQLADFFTLGNARCGVAAV
jgi:CDP-diacylglycerol--serine O-phosphatidyltransferase